MADALQHTRRCHSYCRYQTPSTYEATAPEARVIHPGPLSGVKARATLMDSVSLLCERHKREWRDRRRSFGPTRPQQRTHRHGYVAVMGGGRGAVGEQRTGSPGSYRRRPSMRQ